MNDKDKLIGLFRDIQDVFLKLPFETKMFTSREITTYIEDLERYIGTRTD